MLPLLVLQDVAKNSPADLAGFQDNLDYIIAADTAPLDERDDLFALIESYTGQSTTRYNIAPLVSKWRLKSGFEMCFAIPAPLVPGVPKQNTSRIQHTLM